MFAKLQSLRSHLKERYKAGRVSFRKNWLRLYVGFPAGVFSLIMTAFMFGWLFGLLQSAQGFCTQNHYPDCGFLDMSKYK